jgi:hypothetical protein
MLGHFIPQLQLVVPEWLAEHAEQLFVEGTKNPTAKPAWAAYLIRSRIYDPVFCLLRPWYKQAAEAAGTEVGWTSLEDEQRSLTEPLSLHVLIAFLRGLAALEDPDRLVETTFSNVPASDRGRAYWNIFRGWSDAKSPPSQEQIVRLIQFWEWRLSELEAAGEAEFVVQEVQGLSWFLSTPFIPDHEVVRLGCRTARLSNGKVELHIDWLRLQELLTSDVDTAFEIAELALSFQLRAKYPYVPVDEVKPLLQMVLDSGRAGTQERARSLIHLLGERGYLQFGDLVRPRDQ